MIFRAMKNIIHQYRYGRGEHYSKPTRILETSKYHTIHKRHDLLADVYRSNSILSAENPQSSGESYHPPPRFGCHRYQQTFPWLPPARTLEIKQYRI